LGQKIYENISDEAWKMWMSQQTMLINEYRLSPADPQARKMNGKIFIWGRFSTAR